MNEILKHFQREGIIPVVTISRWKDTEAIMSALLKGGISTIEVTLRTDEGIKSIAWIKENLPKVLVGAGTVTTMKRFEEALSAGADFFVTPGINPIIVERAIKEGKTIVPGCLTPTELDTGILFGLDVFKFFPSECFGGIKTIKALAGPYPDVRFIPTGGINLENARQYLADPHVLALGGSWLVKESWVRDEMFDEITKSAKDARDLVQEIRQEVIDHV